jgi:hypothetical protein
MAARFQRRSVDHGQSSQVHPNSRVMCPDGRARRAGHQPHATRTEVPLAVEVGQTASIGSG